jgi:Concanavalin A-like lectin/glucanases superfamily
VRHGSRLNGVARGAALVVTLAAALPPAAGADGLAGQWRFDEASGQTAIDDGPFGLDGRIGSSAGPDAADPERVPGLSGGALRFDGATFVRLPGAAELAPAAITVEAVVRGDGSPGQFRYIISHGASGCDAASYGLYTGAAGGMAFYVFDGRRYVVTPTAAPEDVWDGRWHHVAGVFDGREVRLAVDGRPVGDPTPAALRIAYALTSTDGYFGTYQGSCALPLRGDVDLVRIWNEALTPGSVAGLAARALDPASNAAPPAPPPAPDTVPPVPSASTPVPAPLTPVAPGTRLDAPAVPASGRPAAAPGAPPRACVVRATPTRLHRNKRTLLTVRVALRGRPLTGARVAVTQGRSVLVRGRTGRAGSARVRVRARRMGRAALAVSGRRDCAALRLTVSR